MNPGRSFDHRIESMNLQRKQRYEKLNQPPLGWSTENYIARNRTMLGTL